MITDSYQAAIDHMGQSLEHSYRILNDAIDEYNPTHVFALFSGGHDSWSTTHLTSFHPRLTAAVHINTGIGIPETREFVRSMCLQAGIPLKEYKAAECRPVPQIYELLIKEYGFPGPGMHEKMYNRLKERCIRQLVREHKVKRRDHIMLVTGVRSQESTRRMGHVEECQHDGVRIWVAPIAHWSAEDVNVYLASRRLPRNPVKDLIHLSGECLCGAFAKPGEREEIKLWFPHVDAELTRLEAVAKAAGKPCVWGRKPPGYDKPRTPRQSKKMMLCTSCQLGAFEPQK